MKRCACYRMNSDFRLFNIQYIMIWTLKTWMKKKNYIFKTQIIENKNQMMYWEIFTLHLVALQRMPLIFVDQKGIILTYLLYDLNGTF